jgi:hypothetical protein
VLGSTVADPLLQAVAETTLGGDHKIIGIRMQCLRDQLFAAARTIDVSGVDEIDAEVDRTAEQADTFRGVVDDTHTAEPKRRTSTRRPRRNDSVS